MNQSCIPRIFWVRRTLNKNKNCHLKLKLIFVNIKIFHFRSKYILLKSIVFFYINNCILKLWKEGVSVEHYILSDRFIKFNFFVYCWWSIILKGNIKFVANIFFYSHLQLFSLWRIILFLVCEGQILCYH